ncbi:Protein argonaute 4 -like protein [Gossypium arboreum]|uniref:Protein argonaute 4-like protein n=1 Tax=Gossypium arboreum TaxID=29729 RepID=A0A0B0PRZ5_GOSAR|nr:Protein argonaute 4 -like protein [Gossypium arboreum]
MLTLGQTPSIPVVSKVPTIILGMGALFGFPEQSDVPSIAGMVSSRWWPLISSYGASGLSDKVDDGIMKEALLDFYTSLGKTKPDQIIIFRDGVSESQFNQGSPDNVLHGTAIENKVCHPKNNDFYLGTHAGMIGITRKAHYHVLLDQAGFSADDLQEFVHSLSFMYQRSTTAIFVVAPICYSHLAASQLGAIYED